MRMGVVADDVTGSNDIGIMFAKCGYLAHIYAFDGEQDRAAATAMIARRVAGDRAEDRPDIVILNTNSRLDAPDVAAAKVAAATQALRDAGCRQFHNKTCSVFRGNIGAEFDAMLDTLGLEFAVVVLGFPKNGRQTIDGIHTVHGARLEDSEFRHDPAHPMTRSDLVGILSSQSRRAVGLIDYRTVARGPGALRAALAEARGRFNYAIVDVVDQDSLRTIAAATFDEPVLCGSSAIAEELPAFWGPRSAPLPGLDLAPVGNLGILCAAGSQMPQTHAQVEAALKAGVVGLELKTGRLFDPAEREAEIDALTAEIVAHLKAGRDTLVRAPAGAEAVAAARRLGAEYGLSGTETSRLVSASLAEVVGRAAERCGLNRIAVAGGETSAAVCERLGARGLRIWEEIQPGLPSCVSLTDPPRLLVLKSGSFGTPEFLLQAIDHLRKQ